MIMPSENTIRDKLSTSLDLLEPGLVLVEVNHKLPNAVGAKGFIDILARDRLGNFVIIELKRSAQSSREALFEILKYIPLFIRLHGVQSYRIRCFIVSTTWHELLVPYSEFRRRCEAQTEGFRIEVDSQGNVTKAEKVADHAEEELAQTFRLHCNYLFPTATERDRALPLLRAAYEAAGATGYLLFRFDYRGSSPNIIFPFAAYVVTTRVKPVLMEQLIQEAKEDLGAGEEDGPDEAELRYSAEDRFLGVVNKDLCDKLADFNLEVAPSNPDRFGYMVEHDWGTPLVERVGPFASTLIMPDAEVVEMVKGLGGENNVRFERITSPSNKLDWNVVRTSAAGFLRGNPTWRAGTVWFFDRVEREFPTGTVLVQVYNPLTLPETLYNYSTTQTSEYVPLLALAAISADGPRNEALVGTVVWDGNMIPSSVKKTFERLAQGVDNILDYYLCKSIGAAWELDEELMRRHGLQYSLCFLKFASEEDKQAIGLLVTEAGIGERPDPLMPDTFIEYFDAARPYLEELFTQIDSAVARLS
jgi:hypothetical protein